VRCALGLRQQSAGCDKTYPDGEKDNDMRFLDLELEDPVPDPTTIWLFS
jgi:hypothetical protein